MIVSLVPPPFMAPISTYHNLILHGSVTASSSRSWGGSGAGVLCGWGSAEVISHIRVELLGRLLGRLCAASTAPLGSGGSTLGHAALARISTRLRGCALGLSLGLSCALGQSLVCRDHLVGLACTNNNLNLDGAAVDEQAVQLLEGLASTICLAENDRCDTTALRVGAVGQLDPLDRANGLNEVFLSGKSVSEFEVVWQIDAVSER
jgi:hypothetical protein